MLFAMMPKARALPKFVLCQLFPIDAAFSRFYGGQSELRYGANATLIPWMCNFLHKHLIL